MCIINCVCLFFPSVLNPRKKMEIACRKEKEILALQLTYAMQYIAALTHSSLRRTVAAETEISQSFLPKELGITPPTLQLVDDALFHLDLQPPRVSWQGTDVLQQFTSRSLQQQNGISRDNLSCKILSKSIKSGSGKEREGGCRLFKIQNTDTTGRQLRWWQPLAVWKPL